MPRRYAARRRLRFSSAPRLSWSVVLQVVDPRLDGRVAALVLDDAHRNAQLHRIARLALRDPARVRLEHREHLLRVGNLLALHQPALRLPKDMAQPVQDPARARRSRRPSAPARRTDDDAFAEPRPV